MSYISKISIHAGEDIVTFQLKYDKFMFFLAGIAQLQPFNGSGSQLWLKSGSALVNRYDPSQCLDVKDNNNDNGAQLCQWGYHGAENQHFYFEYL